jgi:selenophosphate synthase
MSPVRFAPWARSGQRNALIRIRSRMIHRMLAIGVRNTREHFDWFGVHTMSDVTGPGASVILSRFTLGQVMDVEVRVSE